MILIVTGSRHWKDYDRVWSELVRLDPANVYMGDCPTGADFFARQWCDLYGVPYRVEPTLWDEYGRRNGPIRNTAMAAQTMAHGEAGGGVRGLAFWDGRIERCGTVDCMERMARLGVAFDRIESAEVTDPARAAVNARILLARGADEPRLFGGAG